MKHYRIAVIGKRNHLDWDVYVARAFRRLGHEVVLHRFNDFPWWLNGLRGLAQLMIGRRRMREFSRGWRAARGHRRMMEYRPDLVFFTSASLIPEVYFQLARKLPPETCVMGWEGDCDQEPGNWIDYLDHLFEAGRLVQVKFPRYAAKVSSLYFAVDEEVYHNQGKERKNAVYFCGAWSKMRDPFLAALTGVPVVVKGWDWDRLTSRAATLEVFEGTVATRELCADYCTHTLALNISQFDPNSQMLFNMRTFEAPACGACLVTQKIPLTGEIFRIGEEILVYETPEDLATLVQWALAHPDEVARIAQAGEARVMRDHTYLSRMEQVIAKFEEIRNRQASGPP